MPTPTPETPETRTIADQRADAPTTTFVFAGGGTGGHIFPALAIAQQLDALALARSRRVRSIFVVSDRAIDRSILQPLGVEFKVLRARPVGLHPKVLIPFLWRWGQSVGDSRRLLRSIKGETRVVAMGGFVAAPVVRAANIERRPVTLINLDAVPGKANRQIARSARSALSTFRVDEPYAQSWRTIPPIVRAAARSTTPPRDARAALNLDPDAPTLLVTGGSQGAGSLNALLIALARATPSPLTNWQVLHQCGPESSPTRASTKATRAATSATISPAWSIDALRSAYASANVRAIVEPFVRDMATWWGAADLTFSRGGAGAVAEAWANRVPGAFFPYPYHADQHQRFNVEPLRSVGAAVVITDRIDPAQTLAQSGAELASLLSDATARRAMRDAIERLGPADGAEQAAKFLMDS